MDGRTRRLDGDRSAPRHRGVDVVMQAALRLEAVVVVARVRVDLGGPARVVPGIGRAESRGRRGVLRF